MGDAMRAVRNRPAEHIGEFGFVLPNAQPVIVSPSNTIERATPATIALGSIHEFWATAAVTPVVVREEYAHRCGLRHLS